MDAVGKLWASGLHGQDARHAPKRRCARRPNRYGVRHRQPRPHRARDMRRPHDSQQDVALDRLLVDVAKNYSRIMRPTHVEPAADVDCRTALAIVAPLHMTTLVGLQEFEIRRLSSVKETRMNSMNIAGLALGFGLLVPSLSNRNPPAEARRRKPHRYRQSSNRWRARNLGVITSTELAMSRSQRDRPAALSAPAKAPTTPHG